MSEVPATDWSRITGFFAAHVPRLHFELPQISVQDWRRALRKYKQHAARGVDGFSHHDLQQMPDPWVERLLHLLRLKLNSIDIPGQLLSSMGSSVSLRRMRLHERWIASGPL